MKIVGYKVFPELTSNCIKTRMMMLLLMSLSLHQHKLCSHSFSLVVQVDIVIDKFGFQTF